MFLEIFVEFICFENFKLEILDLIEFQYFLFSILLLNIRCFQGQNFFDLNWDNEMFHF